MSVQKHGTSVGVSAGGFVGGGGCDVGVFGLMGMGVLVGRGGTAVGRGGLCVDVGETMMMNLVGVGDEVKVGEDVAVFVGVGVVVLVGMYCANAWAVNAAAVLISAKAWFTRSPGAIAIGSSRLESDKATADVAQNMPNPRMPAANIQSNPA